MNEEYIVRLSVMQQQAEKIQEQIELVNSQMQDLDSLKSSLANLDKGEILANIGRGIFVKAEIKNKDLYVNIGEKVVVKKNTEETQDMIGKQMINLENIKNQLLDDLQGINRQLQSLINETKTSN